MYRDSDEAISSPGDFEALGDFEGLGELKSASRCWTAWQDDA